MDVHATAGFASRKLTTVYPKLQAILHTVVASGLRHLDARAAVVVPLVPVVALRAGAEEHTDTHTIITPPRAHEDTITRATTSSRIQNRRHTHLFAGIADVAREAFAHSRGGQTHTTAATGQERIAVAANRGHSAGLVHSHTNTLVAGT